METLSSLLSDIRRLLALTYPTEHSDLHDTIAIRSYINAIYDRDLAIPVSEREPEQLQEAYKISVRLQTYRQAELESGRSGQRNKPRVNFIHEADGSTGAVDKSWEKRMQALEKALKATPGTPPMDYAHLPYPPSFNYLQPPPPPSFRNGYRVSIRRKHRALFHKMPGILGMRGTFVKYADVGYVMQTLI